MTLAIDTFALLVMFSIAILRLNEKKHDIVRTLLWAMVAAGTFGLGCEQIARGKVFGTDVWPIMMHVGMAGLMFVRFACYKPPRGVHERRLT